jgi:VWFA-related protein
MRTGLLVLTLAAVAAGQTPPPAAVGPQSATVQAPPSGGLFSLDVRAVDRAWRPVLDLRAEDLVLSVDNVVRPIRELHFEPAALTERAIVLVFDEPTISGDRSAQTAARAFLGKLNPRDGVALVTLAGAQVGFTTERGPIRRALDRVESIHIALSNRTCRDAANFGRPVLLQLIDVLERLVTIPGPKTVVFVSGGVPAGNRLDCAVMLQNIERAIALADVSLYVVESLDGPAGTGLFGLQDLARLAGGELFRDANGAGRAFDQILRETATRYRIGFEVLDTERDGARHSIRITAPKKKDVFLRYRWSFVAPPQGVTLSKAFNTKVAKDTKNFR